VSQDHNVPLKAEQREQVYIKISILYMRRQGLADVEQLLQSYTARQWQRQKEETRCRDCDFSGLATARRKPRVHI